MSRFATRALPAEPDDVAPDGSDVRLLARLSGGSMAHFELAAGKVSAAVTHRTVEEIWYVLAGSGEMWRCQHGHEFTAENTWVNPKTGARQCRECSRERLRVRRRKGVVPDDAR